MTIVEEVIKFGANYLVALCPTVFAFVFWKAQPAQRRTLLIRGLLVLALALAFAKIGGMLYHEPRPFVARHEKPLIPHAPDNAFPSDHTLLAASFAFLILPYSMPLAILTGLIAVLVGASRIACLLHSPLDIAASITFAAAANVIASLAVKRAQPLSR